MALLAIAGGIRVGSALLGRRQKKKAASEQSRLDAENIRLYQAEVGESVRRTEESQSQTEGVAQAQAGGS